MSLISKCCKLIGKISWVYFIVSAIVGFMFIFLLGPQEKKIYVYPQENTLNKSIFQDNSNTCYKIVETKTECPLDSTKLNSFPIQ